MVSLSGSRRGRSAASSDLGRFAELIVSKGITDLVVWGLPTNSHTHHFIHRAAFECFSAVAPLAGVRVHWTDDRQGAPVFDRAARCLFFSSPHYGFDRHLPLLPASYYVAHSDWGSTWPDGEPITKYEAHLEAGHALYWAVFRGFPDHSGRYETLDASTLTFYDSAQRRLMMPWATDALPAEIDKAMRTVRRRYRTGELFGGNDVLFVGSVWRRNQQAMEDFSAACSRNGLRLKVERIYDKAAVMRATRRAYMAPAIQGEGHIGATQFYAPCRIFKNLSYGAVGVTNNPGVHHLFDDTLVYADQPDDLVNNYRNYIASFDTTKLDELLGIMETVRDRHTYVQRLTHCLQLLT